jgi:hypothetical protein
MSDRTCEPQPRLERPDAPGSSLRKLFILLRSTLREIFDESAYTRFLERRGLASSREAYAEFLREGQAVRERRPRCC